MRRREFMSALLLASATSVRAQERAEQHRIAIIRPAGPTALISDTGIRFYRAFFEELRRLGDSEGRNLTVERYSGEGRPEGFLGLAREVVNRNPEVIVVANSNAIAQAAHAADRRNTHCFDHWRRSDPDRAGNEPRSPRRQHDGRKR